MIGKLDAVSSPLPAVGKSPAASAATTGMAPAGDFAALLSEVVGNSIETLRQGEVAAAQGLKGEIPIQDAVNKVLEAEQSLQVGIALRDKVVAAYLEISRMTI